MTEPDPIRRRLPLALLIAAGVLAAVVIGVVWAQSGGDDPADTTVAAADTTTTSGAPRDSRPRPPQVEDSLPLPDGAHAYAAAWDGASLWALVAAEPVGPGDPAPDEATVLAIDPATGEVVSDIPVSGGPSRLAVDSDGVWLALAGEGRVVRLDPATGEANVTADLPEDAAPVDWLVAILGPALVSTEDGQVLRVAPDGTVSTVVELTPEQSGEVVADQEEVWILSRSGDRTATLVDPLEATSREVPLDVVDHPVTHGGFAFSEMALAEVGDDGAVVTIVDRSTLEPVETVEVPGSVVYLGWVAGSFGTLDDEGVFQRLRPTDFGAGRFQTSWDGVSPIVPLDQELWTISADGSSIDRVVLTGSAD